MRSEEEIRERIYEIYKGIEKNRDPNLSEEENAYNLIPMLAGLAQLKWVIQEND